MRYCFFFFFFSLSIPGNQENSKQSKANKLFEKCLQAYECDVESLRRIPEIPEVLFLAAEVGNIEFLVKLIRFDFDLLWERNKDRKNIFHIAVEKRHESIFILLNELDSVGDIIVSGILGSQNNILHLAAGVAPQEKHIRSCSSNATRTIMVQGTYSYVLSSKC